MNSERLQKTKAVYTPLIASVIAWADERNFFDPKEGATEGSQLVKLVEELGEFAHALARISKPEMRDKLKDGLGDAQVVLINMLKLSGGEAYLEHAKIMIPEYVQFMSEVISETSFDESGFTISQSVLGGAILSIGDQKYHESFCDLIVLENQLGFEPGECLQAAYDEIKDRKGKFINRVFVKESDL